MRSVEYILRMLIDLKNASKEELIQAYRAALASAKNSEQKHQSTSSLLQRSLARTSELEIENKWLRNQLFGQKSEREISKDPRQGSLGLDVPEVAPAASVTITAYERSARKKPTEIEASRVRFDDSVPVEEVIILPEEVQGLDESEYEVIGEKVTERLVQTPSTFKRIRTVRKTVKVKDKLLTAPAPPAVIHRSFADVTFLACLLVDKFQYHLPLYRQHKRMEAAGVHVNRGHLSTLVLRSLELLEPIYLAIVSQITTSTVVSMDETPVKAGRRLNGKMNTAYFWPVFADNQVAFIYSSSRAHKTVADVLKRGCQKLMSDGYQAYEKYAASRPELIHAECYAHVRRKFFEAKDHSPPECEHVLNLLRELFEIEKRIQSKPLEEILAERRLCSAPLVRDFFSYCDELWHTKMILKDSPLGKAVRYALKRKDKLHAFLEHPDIPLSNNHVERAIRPVALGRKNWMFCWSEIGAKYAAMAYTLVGCCKLAGVDPWKYLVDVLQRIDSHPAQDVDLLTPLLWKEHFGG